MRIVRLLLIMPLLWAVPVVAETVHPALAAAGWKMFTFPDHAPAQFRPTEEGGVEVEAQGGVAGLFRLVKPEDALRPVVSWRWRVDRADIRIVDLSRKANADRPVAVHVGFEQDETTGGFFRNLAASMMGLPPPGRVLTYTWGGIHPTGTSFESPHMGADGEVIILRPGNAPLQQWYEETVDVDADFRRFFGYRPPPIAYIAISGDADDQPGHTRARVADIRLKDR
ncbi:DUF3047 domain-containing protein [Oceanibaculum pacificum]|uniref:DUF3047 domain-containing protein n=1 Tax=Oceanibaculum pacificum TaxID=580166 RepID=A0A154VAM6_9PROT|nr:DUF3047 domain-containing protein [Oceanibaculum pacificum]KZC98319.1 hypothetical protein AUP43_03825 [Oceanibaculum pacificum]